MRRVCKGFTLVELSLSIAFISILTITVALIIRDAVSSYQRGLTLNKINTVGMDLVDDMRAVIQGSPANALKNICAVRLSGSAVGECESENAYRFINVERRAIVRDRRTNAKIASNVPIYGAFCTGTYSYIWNSGYFFNGDYKIVNTGDAPVSVARFNYNYDGEKIIEGFRLLKVQDKTFSVCEEATTAGSSSRYGREIGTNFRISGELFEEPEDLLAGGGEGAASSESNLAIYDLYTSMPAASGNGSALFYPVSFILGTVQSGINIMASSDFCAAPEEYNGYIDYCAINKFNFAAQAIGG